MKQLTAKNARQLDLCLRMLYAEGTEFIVEVHETTKKKIEYLVHVKTDDDTMKRLEETFRILIS